MTWMTADARFWTTFLDWHVRTDHPWDVALHVEAMSLSTEAFARQLGEALRPTMDRVAAALAKMADAIRTVPA